MNYRGNEQLNSDDSLQHWKYIKRERKNGKWKYYYHDDNNCYRMGCEVIDNTF